MSLTKLTTGFRSRLIISAYNPWLSVGATALDVGCGNGLISSILAKHFRLRLVGCDIHRYLIKPIKFVLLKSPDALPFRRHQFDVVMFNDVLHHVAFNHQQKLIKQALTVGKVVLLFEFQPTTLSKFADQFINYLYHRHQHFLFSYRQISQWEKLFHDAGAGWEKQIVTGPWWYPFHHLAYRLTKEA